MIVDSPDSLSLEELSLEVQRLLEVHSLLGAQVDHRVSAAPDMRTIRYYTTLGLLDRPVIQGRQARYGKRHVLQLLAIKMLQGTSLPLAEVQSRLYGLSNAELTSVIESVANAIKATESQIEPVTTFVCWREIVIEPGLKVLAEEGWSPASDPALLEKKIRAALAAMQIHARRAMGGSSNEYSG